MITTYPVISNNTPVVVYDMSLPFPQRKDSAIEFDSIRKAGSYLYVSHKVASRGARSRTRVYSATKGKEFAIRYKTK